ncbi:zinc ribbon domain-containing protein [Luteimicrobium sp. DT211]|uniref:zinc ribbon domain-containing protein n=1 Tax=Luteimicrobium sp. DT211 TaxID=3393412 RepID=UPI003CF30708
MATAPASDQLRLLDVQALDTRLQQLAHRRAASPAIAKVAEVESRLADVHTSLVQSRTAAEDLRREVAKAEQDVEQVRTRAARDQQRLDSGAVGAKDAQALVAELASLARRQGTLEEVELDVMERLEAHESALAELESAHAQLVAEKESAEAERAAEVGDIDETVVQVRTDREKTVDGLDAGLLALYDRVRAQSGGLGAAALRGRRCEGCRLELNPGDLRAIAGKGPDEIVRCEECGRILVRVEPAGQPA